MFNYIMWSAFIFLSIVLIDNVFKDEILYDKNWERYARDKEIVSRNNDWLKVAIYCCIPLLRWIFLAITVGMIFVDYYDVKEYLKS